MTVDVNTRDGEALRMAMVDRLVADHAAKGRQLRPDVEAAMRTVPRHLYTPGEPLATAYEDKAVVTKRRGSQDISSVSAPLVISEMLCQAADALGEIAGRHVLEIGSVLYRLRSVAPA
jgi:protein-L-isoaspartate(D-aspartate) O-methyltransferase